MCYICSVNNTNLTPTDTMNPQHSEFGKIYQAIQRDQHSNTIVRELNAAVLTATFPGKGVFDADLYISKNEAPALVFSGSCPPVNAKIRMTVRIEIK